MEKQVTGKLNEKSLNGVDVGRLFNTIDAVKGDPDIAKSFETKRGDKNGITHLSD